MQSQIARGCGCNFTTDDVLGGAFSCPDSLTTTAVVYRSDVRGIDNSGCDNLVDFLREAMISSPSVNVLGNRLDLLTICDTSVSSATSEFSCPGVGGGDETAGGGGISIAVIAGAAGGGCVVLLLLLVCVILLVLFRRREKLKRM